MTKYKLWESNEGWCILKKIFNEKCRHKWIIHSGPYANQHIAIEILKELKGGE